MAQSQLPPLLDKQIAQLRAHDLSGMMNNYHPEGMVMRPGATAVGKDQIHDFFQDYLNMNPEIVEVMTAEQSDDTILYHAKIGIGGKVHADVGTWILRDGLIWRQTAVLVAGDE